MRIVLVSATQPQVEQLIISAPDAKTIVQDPTADSGEASALGTPTAASGEASALGTRVHTTSIHTYKISSGFLIKKFKTIK
jgi:hypothetical protein